MIDINLNGALPTHVDRIKPNISVDSAGKINWTPGYLDYNASNYFPGKTVKSEEFNKHNLQHVYQGNYITDVLQLIFDKHLPDAIYKLFTSEFDLVPSFVKTFTADDWGEKQEDGYYYITVTAEEHGFPADTAEGVLERMNIDTEMYLLNTDGNFYEVQQISTASDNTVQAYSDDNTLAGFLVIRTNDKAYALAEASIHASQIVGLADSALSGKYADLVDLTKPDGTGPDDRITANAKGIASILSGVDDDNNVVKAAKALQADSANEAIAVLGTGTLGGRVIDNIFEVGSNTVKKATLATDYDTTTGSIKSGIESAINTVRALQTNLTTAGENNISVLNAQHADKDMQERSIADAITALNNLIERIVDVEIICTKPLPVTKEGAYGMTTVTYTTGTTAEFSIKNKAGLSTPSALYRELSAGAPVTGNLASHIEFSVTDLATSFSNSKIIVTVTKGGSYTASGAQIPDSNVTVALFDIFGNFYYASDGEE